MALLSIGQLSTTNRSCQVHQLFQSQIKALSSLARLRLLNVLVARLRRLNPHRLDFILDLELELHMAETRKAAPGRLSKQITFADSATI
jgi:hypothetical protein